MRWIIGDIHGMLGPLERLLTEIDRRDPDAELLFTGDYVNRGPDTRRVIELLLTLDNARFLRGNHDDVFDQLINGESFASGASEFERLASFAWFMQFGLDDSLHSYGASAKEMQDALRRMNLAQVLDLFALVPQKHRQFIRGLLVMIEFDDLFVLHAKWDVDTPDKDMLQLLEESEEARHEALWGRYTPEEIAAEKAWKRTGYFGHTPVQVYSETGEPAVVVGDRIVLVDTGAAVSDNGRLTAFCHESEEVVQVDRQNRLIA